MNNQSVFKYLKISDFFIILGLVTPCIVCTQLAYFLISSKYIWCSIIAAPGVICLLVLLSRQKKFDVLDGLVAAFLLYLILNAYCFSNSYPYNRKLNIYLAGGVFYFLVKLTLDGRSGLQRYFKIGILLTVIFLISIVCIIWGGLQFIHVLPVYTESGIISGPFYHPAPMAGFISMIGVLALSIYWYLNKKYRLATFSRYLKELAAITVLLTLFALPFLKSRASFVCFLAGSIFAAYRLGFLKPVIKSIRTYYKSIGVVLLILGLAGSVGIYKIRPASANGRLLVWKISMLNMGDNLFEGKGLGKFSRLYPDYQIRYFTTPGATAEEKALADEVSDPFNDYIEFFFETGLIGLIFFVGIIVFSFRQSRLNISNKANISFLAISVQATLISLLVFAVFSYPFSMPEFVIYFFILLAISSKNSPRSNGRLPKAGISTVIVLSSVILIYNMPHNVRFIGSLQRWNAANEAFAGGDNKTALNNYDNAYVYLKNEEQFLTDYGSMLAQIKHPKASISILNQKETPKYHTLVLLAEQYLMLADYQNSLDFYNKAHFLLPNEAYPIYKLFKINAYLGNRTTALTYAQEFVKSTYLQVPEGWIEEKRELMTFIAQSNK